MKIAVLSSFTTSLFWFRIDMMKAFINAGCEVLAVGDAPEAEWENKFAELGIRYRSIPVQRNGTNPLYDLKTLSAIKKLFREEKPDKVFAYQAKTVIYGGIAAKQVGINEIYPLIAGVGSVFLGNNLKTKIIRNILVTEYKLGMRNVPAAFFQNRDDLGVFASHRIVDTQKVVMLHGSGVNIDKFKPTPLPQTPTFLCISRLIRDKGVWEYLEAARIIKKQQPSVRCMLVGPFDTNPSAITSSELQGYIDDGSIEYFGEQKNVAPYLAACTAYVLPSYHEGTPKTVLEAMASGRAVITTDAPGCRETVTDGKNGFLVPVQNVDEIVQAMKKLIENPLLAKEMGDYGRQIAIEKYDVNLVNQTILSTMKITEEI